MTETLFHLLAISVLVYGGVCVIYFFFQEKFLFVPTFKFDHSFRAKVACEVEEFELAVPHEGKIHAILLRSKAPKGLVFYLHGNTGSLKRWQFMAEEISSYGFDVFAMDYRGYGRSEGGRSEAKMHRDVEFCFDFIRPKYESYPVIIYGRSLGTGFATKLASRRIVDGLVLETPFNSLIDVARHRLPFLPVDTLLRYKFRNDIYLPHVSCPVHIFHGTKDKIVRHSQALKLYRKSLSLSNIEMTTLVGGRHGNLNTYPLFRERLSAFFSSILLLNSHRAVRRRGNV